MGSSKQSTSSSSSSSQSVTPTPMEKQLEQMQMNNLAATYPQMTALQQQGMGLSSQILGGNVNLPGFLGTMAAGIDPNTISGSAQEMARQFMPQAQAQGLTNSGSAFGGLSKEIANQLLLPAQQFNISNYQNLLNMALGGVGTAISGVQGGGAQLGSQLAGLRGINTQGTSQSTTTTTPSALQNIMTGMQGVGQLASGVGGLGSGLAAQGFNLFGNRGGGQSFAPQESYMSGLYSNIWNKR